MHQRCGDKITILSLDRERIHMSFVESVPAVASPTFGRDVSINVGGSQIYSLNVSSD